MKMSIDILGIKFSDRISYKDIKERVKTHVCKLQTDGRQIMMQERRIVGIKLYRVEKRQTSSKVER